MSIILPIDGRWSQPNNSDKFGSLWATKNITLDEAGYLKLSPRAVRLIGESDNDDFGVPLAIGKFQQGQFQVLTSSNANFVVEFSTIALNATEDSGSSEPTATFDSDAKFWQNRWHASTATTVVSKDANGSASATWTSRITGLTSGVKHIIEVFDSRNNLVVSNGNVLEQYDTSYANTVDLTIPSDFEIVGAAYNDGKMGVITATGSGTTGQTLESKFYLWTGSETSATGWGVGSDLCMCIAAYQSSWVILTRNGQLKLFNGGGFTELAALPFYFSKNWWSTPSGGAILDVHGNSAMWVDGDKVFINLGLLLNPFGKKEEQQLPNVPSGIWCYDPAVTSVYHRTAGSNSPVYLVQVNASAADTATDILTASSGTIPATGNPVIQISESIGGFTIGELYYVIKLSASTFALATTRENALAGTKIDITSTNASNAFFHMYDIVDYAITAHEDTGAIGSFQESRLFYTGLLFGGDYPLITNLSNNDALCYQVPLLENRGWAITPRKYSTGARDSNNRVLVKFRPLKTNDKIIVKVKDRDVEGLPVSSPNSAATDYLTWTSNREGYTTTDLSQAKAYLDAGLGRELEMEFVSGAGAGQMVKIEDIDESSGTYALVLAEDVVGAASGRLSHFIIDNWKVKHTITSSANEKGYVSVPLQSSRKFVQCKVELRGYETTIEEFSIIDATKET